MNMKLKVGGMIMMKQKKRYLIEETDEYTIYYEIDEDKDERRICAMVPGNDYWQAFTQLLTFLADLEHAKVVDLDIYENGGYIKVVFDNIYYDIIMEVDTTNITAKACVTSDTKIGSTFGEPWCPCSGGR